MIRQLNPWDRLKALTRASLNCFGVKAMSLRTWNDVERTLTLRKCLNRHCIDVLELLIAREFADGSPFFIQVGANDGVGDDQWSSFVIARGWQGILVEPQPEAFQRLKSNYGEVDGLKFENVAISPRPEPLKLYRYRNGRAEETPRDKRTSFDQEILIEGKKRFGWNYDIESFEVPTVMLQALLEKYGRSRCDLLVVDTEGMDFDVIRTLDFTIDPPSIIQFEHLHLSDEDLANCLEFLAAFGYSMALVRRDIIAHRRRTSGRCIG